MSDLNAAIQGYHDHARREVLRLLPTQFAKVVDVGGAAGSTLSAIRQMTPEAATICLDADEHSLDRARARGHQTVLCDLNREIPNVFDDCDVVLFLDILEHLNDPWAVLARIAGRLRPNTTVVVSLPNVRYWSVSLDLVLRGRWKLQDAGVLDRTHLRFFTRSTGVELVKNSGLVLTKITAKVATGRRFKLIDALTLGVFRDFLSPQYLYLATKK
jgi:2-polyprenyl-3-methyl-5-hydroxy-6-metoxy-1,4-benzoquinol methylase